jgi:SET and MYND domain-containing protein
VVENLPHQVKSLKTLEEKVGKVLENLSVCKKISSWLSICSETKYAKSGGMAGKLRDQGNIKFGARDNNGALKLYTESVICAPYVGPELGLAFANRSAALYHLGQYQAACDDINMALQHKYPKHLEYKLVLRKAQSMIRLAQYKEGLVALEHCESALDISKLTEEKKRAVVKDIAALKTEAEGLQRNSPLETKISSPLEFTNPDLPGASPKLRLDVSNDKVRGRFITSNEKIEVGEVLFSESPYSCVLLPPHYSTHCNECLAVLLAPVPCRYCTQTRYCSGSCRDTAWSHQHQHECGQLDLLHSVGIGHLAVRTILRAGRDALLSIRGPVKAGTYSSTSTDPYFRVFNLQHHLDRLPVEEVFQYTLTAALLVTMLNKNTAFLSPERAVSGLPGKLRPVKPGMEVEDKVLHYMGGLILRHLAQLVGNAHDVTELHEGADGDVEQVRLATGIYPSASMMNHSCIPLIINSFTGPRIVVRAVTSISAGSEVTNCYGPHYRRHNYLERQEMLSSQYMFRCFCRACTDTKERMHMDRFQAFQCIKCKGPVISNTCEDCGEVSENILEKKYESIQAMIDSEGDVDIDTLEKAESELSTVLYVHHQSLARVRDRLARDLSTRGDYAKAVKYLKQTLETTAARFGSDSIEFGHELLKLTDVLAALHSAGEDIAVKTVNIVDGLKMAANIFGLQYGTNSKQFIDIQEKLCYLGAA